MLGRVRLNALFCVAVSVGVTLARVGAMVVSLIVKFSVADNPEVLVAVIWICSVAEVSGIVPDSVLVCELKQSQLGRA